MKRLLLSTAGMASLLFTSGCIGPRLEQKRTIRVRPEEHMTKDSGTSMVNHTLVLSPETKTLLEKLVTQIEKNNQNQSKAKNVTHNLNLPPEVRRSLETIISQATKNTNSNSNCNGDSSNDVTIKTVKVRNGYSVIIANKKSYKIYNIWHYDGSVSLKSEGTL